MNGLLNILATLIQIICLPVNLVIESALPDLSFKLTEVSSSIQTIFSPISWAISIVPPSIIEILLFILTIEIAKHTIFKSTHVITKVWNVLQKVKFW